MKSILIIEDEILVARSTEAILSNFGYHVVGIATNNKQARLLLNQNQVDLILCDINLNDNQTGIELMRDTKEKHQIPFIFISSYSDRYTLESANQLYPHSYLTKPFNEKQLLATVNRFFLQPTESHTQPTPRELVILSLISKGKSTRNIAEALSITVNTVESHRKNLLKKYQVKSMPELVCLATSKGWISYEAC
jgi:DNA-binding NarL/FixJ family response regulator